MKLKNLSGTQWCALSRISVHLLITASVTVGFTFGTVLAADVTNPGGSTVADMTGTTEDDNYTNDGTVTNDIDMRQGGTDTVVNTGDVGGEIYGASSDGNSITNSGTGTVTGDIFGSHNESNNDSGGSNTINNNGGVSAIIGSHNEGVGSSGGNNTVNNAGTVTGSMRGSLNTGANSTGGHNRLSNNGTANFMVGSHNSDGSVGGSNILYNYDTVNEDIRGSFNIGDNSSGGSNTIYNYGNITSELIGSMNIGNTSSGGSNTITNSGTVGDDFFGSYNFGNTSSGGSNTITNSGTVGDNLYGSYNEGDDSSGGSNTIINSGTVEDDLFGSWNNGDNSSGGSNHITNSGTVANTIYGSFNWADNSTGGGNTIINSGRVNSNDIFGAWNRGDGASSDGNSITNSGFAGDSLVGSWNQADNTHGSSHNISNSGFVDWAITGSINDGDSSTGGSNVIHNSGEVTRDIIGSENNGIGASGGGNTITNSGLVNLDIIGSENDGSNTSGGGNTIRNEGTVRGDIIGSDNLYSNSSSTGNTIFNFGSVGGDIFGSQNVAGATGGNDRIANGGTVGGSIYGMDGDDQVTVQNGPENVGGVIDGGADFDTIVYSGGVWTQNHPKVVNFEDLEINATHHLTLSGPWDIGGRTAFVNGGILDVPDTLVAGGLDINSGTANITGTADINGETDVDGTLNVPSSGTLYTDSLLVGGGGLVDLEGVIQSDSSVNDGSFKLNGTLQSPLTNYGFLSGNGTVIGNVTNNGRISPGNSIGTITIQGSYTHNPGAIYLAELNSNGRSDLIAVSGSARLNGGTVRAYLPRGLYKDGYSWTILRASGGINGTFSSISGQPNSATLSLQNHYTAATANIIVDRKGFNEFGSNENTKAVGTGLDTVVPLAVNGGTSMEHYLTSLDFDHTAPEISTVLKEINPEMYTSFSTSARMSADHFTQSMRKRLGQKNELLVMGIDKKSDGSAIMTSSQTEYSEDDLYNRNWQLWGRAFGGTSERDSDANNEGFSQSSAGLILGGDGQVFDTMRLGFAFGTSTSSLDFDTRDDGDQSSIFTGVYGDLFLDKLHIDFSVSYGWHNGDALREISLPTTTYFVDSDLESISLMLHAGGDYLFELSSWLLGPTMSLDYVLLSTDDFTESSGSVLDLRITDQEEDHFISRLGGKLTKAFRYNEAILVPRIELAWIHDFNSDDNTLSASYVGFETSRFEIQGASVPEDVINVETGLNAYITDRFTAFAELTANFGDDYSDYFASVGIEWLF